MEKYRLEERALRQFDALVEPGNLLWRTTTPLLGYSRAIQCWLLLFIQVPVLVSLYTSGCAVMGYALMMYMSEWELKAQYKVCIGNFRTSSSVWGIVPLETFVIAKAEEELEQTVCVVKYFIPQHGAGSTGFFSISTLRTVINPKTLQKERLYKIFSPAKLTSDFLSNILGAPSKLLTTLDKDNILTLNCSA